MPKKTIPIFIIIFFMLSFSSCTCIYFNTFHNIRKSFGAAEKSRQKAARDRATGSEIKNYNDAVTKASKVLEKHPNSSWVDDALYIIGASYYYLGKFDQASRKFKELNANFPESEFISSTRVLYAKTKLELKEEAEAIVIFEEIFDKEPDRQMRADAARSLGQYYFETREYDKANIYFQTLIDSLGDESDKLRALTYVADGYFDIYMFEKAQANYLEALNNDPDTLQYYRLTFRMAECDYFLNDIAAGLEKLGDLADNDLYYDSLAPIRLRMAEGYEWDGDMDAAIDIFEKIITENPGEEAAAQAFYELGLIYQYDLEDLKRARTYYGKAREEKKGSMISEDATRRASMLSLLEQYSLNGEEMLDSLSEQVSQQEIDQASKNLFLLGELFYFDLEKGDSAIHTYEQLLDRYPISAYAPKALMSLAYIHREELADTSAADSLLWSILDNYADWDEIESVVEIMGLAGTTADTGYAALTFAVAEDYLVKFITLDSTRFYLQLEADSVQAELNAKRADSIRVADSIHVADSLMAELLGDDFEEDKNKGDDEDTDENTDSTALIDSVVAVDTILITDTTVTIDTLYVLDSIYTFDSTLAVDSVFAIDSLIGDDSVLTIDTAFTFDSVYIIDSLVAMDSVFSFDSVQVIDSTTIIDTLWASESAALMEKDSLAVMMDADTTVIDAPIPVLDSILHIDSVLTVDTIWAIDSMSNAVIPFESDSTLQTDSVQVFDTTLTVDSILVLDSLYGEDSTLTIDSSFALDTAYLVDSIVASSPPLLPSLPVETTRFDSVLTLDSNLVLDSLYGEDSTLTIDSSFALDTAYLVDTIVASSPPLLPPSPVEMTRFDSVLTLDSNLVLDSLYGEDSTLSIDTVYAVDSVYVIDSVSAVELHPVPDSMFTVDSIWTIDSIWVIDSSSIPIIDPWEEARPYVESRYNQLQLELLDSAHYYYQYVIDSFPHSEYGVQARYVLVRLYDEYLTPGDSLMLNMYMSFVDSFPESEYTLAIGDKYRIFPSSKPPTTRRTGGGEEDDEEAEESAADSVESDEDDLEFNAEDSSYIPQGAASKFVTGDDGKVLEPAEKYYLSTRMPFKYPLEAVAYNIQGDLYFHIRIDFLGEVVEANLLNPTASEELNTLVLETVKESKFDSGRIPPELYDNWFYYRFKVRMPDTYKQ
ncbi:MAG: tetratricopeptide repeat protein [FCB group bacterium]|nr:tetratricopeptide repeat protein [FCB group bacterium]